MEFRVLSTKASLPKNCPNTVFLRIDRWNDYSFVTLFHMTVSDKNGQYHDIGDCKIGFKGQTISTSTYERMDDIFEKLGEEFFSLGQTSNYYKNLASLDTTENILIALRDVVFLPSLIDELKNEEVFGSSLLRYISLSTVRGQFRRILEGKAELTDFKFKFTRPESNTLGGLDIRFEVDVGSTPSTNIHALIGRNGVGKTTILNGMTDAIINKQSYAKFINLDSFYESEITEDYFSSLVSVSFSAFDSFNPPREQSDPAKGTCYFYIGLKDNEQTNRHRTIHDLRDDCVKALIVCFSLQDKTLRWCAAINKLGTDENFALMNLERLLTVYKDLRERFSEEQQDLDAFKNTYSKTVDLFLSRMSSGHAIVLLTITKLVATVEEKTLVLLDEPESHLHPPLLSAFIRALADLLHDRNGLAIIATHSPVVLQEIPRSCVWKIYRVGRDVNTKRPDLETFGENVGLLTSEVFSLEVERSGFHSLLAKSVNAGKTYDEILIDYKNQLGLEGRAILKSLVAHRDRSNDHDETK